MEKPGGNAGFFAGYITPHPALRNTLAPFKEIASYAFTVEVINGVASPLKYGSSVPRGPRADIVQPGSAAALMRIHGFFIAYADIGCKFRASSEA